MTDLSLTFWQILTLGGGLLGAFAGLVRLLLAQAERRLDERFLEMERSRAQSAVHWGEQFSALGAAQRANDQRLGGLLADLPLHYQRREDAIRQEVAIIARLDALATKVGKVLECDLRHCPVREVLDDHSSH